MHYFIFIFFFYLFHCQAIQTKHVGKPNDCKIKINEGVHYGQEGNAEDRKGIIFVLEELLTDICHGNLEHLPKHVDPNLGLFIDAKGYLNYQEVLKDLGEKNGYFATYFFNQELLDQRKASQGNLTVQQVFETANEIKIDFYFESMDEAELKFHFSENQKNTRYLINPIFRKVKKEWKIVRMF
ncbi:putative lipoprotein [Leptospira ryugenii]|uniref:Putative lipoprotein n=1 Tax=Leptospira ryugenii TaxID=1917863 RepID=A0A2P2DXG8_9LEPT|nr:hypothetical protein [Leptospira ryugenii]GBF49323.1 putative lipoprotein [Leptospira ryugenii]